MYREIGERRVNQEILAQLERCGRKETVVRSKRIDVFVSYTENGDIALARKVVEYNIGA